MDWFNYYGLVFMVIIMLPNIIVAVKSKNGFENNYNNKAAAISEQIGRYGCIAFMIFNIPYTYFGFWFKDALVVYLAVESALCFIYCISWIIFANKNGKAKALTLSVIPTVVFLFGGIVVANIPLIVFAVIFGASHILISYKNAE